MKVKRKNSTNHRYPYNGSNAKLHNGYNSKGKRPFRWPVLYSILLTCIFVLGIGEFTLSQKKADHADAIAINSIDTSKQTQPDNALFPTRPPIGARRKATATPHVEASSKASATPTATAPPTPAPTRKVKTSPKADSTPKVKASPKATAAILPTPPPRSSNEKIIALTFDDGPHSSNTLRILDALTKNDAVATFFVVGNRVDMYPKLVQKAFEQGNEISSHTYTHANLMKISLAEAREELDKASAAIKKACGKAPALVRPPEGAICKERAEALDSQMVLWTVDPQDWKNHDAQTIVDNIMQNIGNHSIVLLHDLYDSSAEAVELLLPKLKAKGYHFLTMSEFIERRRMDGRNINIIYPT